MIALQYHEVKIILQIANAEAGARSWDNSGISTLTSLKLYADYIYLDTDERRRFAQVSHEYLIEQVQNINVQIGNFSNKKINLTFNHPVKELIWIGIPGSAAVAAGPSTPTTINTGNTYQLKLNGHDRFSRRKGNYFNWVQPYQHHTNVPATGINVYSFALKPEEHQPSGTCNFSRIDNANLNLTVSTITASANLYIFATNYNVLRVMSGMGGLAYSN